MATPNNPNLIIPRLDLSFAALAVFTENSDGSWTNVTTAPFNGPTFNAVGGVTLQGASILKYIDSIALSIDPTLVEAISVDATYMNRVQGPIDASASIIENVRRATTATGGPVIPQMLTGYSAVALQFAYNGIGTHNDIYTILGRWQRFGAGVQGVGAQKASLVISLADTSYTTVGSVAGIAPISITRN